MSARSPRRFSLGPTLVSAFVLAALVPALLVAWLLSSNSSQSINTLAENAMSQAAHRVDVGALAHLGESHTVVNALVPPFVTTGAEAERTRRWLADPEAFETMAFALTQQSPNVPYLYFGTTDGTFFGLEREDSGFVARQIRPGESGRRHYQLAYPGDRSQLVRVERSVYDPRKRPWYQLATATGKRTFTDVYRSAVKAQFDLTLAQPIFDRDGTTLLGVIAVDMSLARLTELIRSTRISANAVTYLVDSQGLMVASSAPEPLSHQVLDKHQRISPLQSTEPLIRASFAQLRAQFRPGVPRDTGLVRLDTQPDWAQRLGLSSNRLIALQRPFGQKYDLDWQLIVVAPEADFTSQVTQARQWALLAMAGLIGLSGLLAFAVARGLSRQFRRLNASATAVGAGQVPAVQARARFSEVHHLSQVMHDSALQLQAYNREVQQKNEALRDAAQLLEQRVRLRTAELATSREEALAAVKAKAGFLAVMSHEIRTPLNGVVGMGELLTETALSPAQNELLGVLRVSSEQLLAVVDDILDFSKIESGKLLLEHRPMDLRAAIQDACQIIKRKAEEKHLRLDVQIASDVPLAVHGDVTRLRQVLLNLLSNAIKFTPQGSVTLRVWVAQPAQPKSESLLGFSVTDTGVGISPERLAHLFQPFAQGDTSTARLYGGTGLGLMISKHLVELMGGQISVHSQPGVGSTFSFTLQAPVAQPQQVATAPAAPLPPTTQAQRVLVVDDNRVNLQVASAMLQRLGYPHDTVTSGFQAIAAIEQAQHAARPYAFVLLDTHMPEFDGVATARNIVEKLGARAPVIIGVSASTLGEDRQRGLDAGMSEHLTKPLNLQALARALQPRTGPPRAHAPTTEPEPSEAAEPPWLDSARWNGFDDLGGTPGSLRCEIMGEFLQTLDQRVRAIEEAAAQQQHAHVQQAAHLLHGAAANVGATRLAQACLAIERSARQQALVGAELAHLVACAQGTRRAMQDAAEPH